MKPYVSFFLAVITLLGCGLSTSAAQEPSTNVTYVIPIKGVIEAGLLYTVDRGLQKAKAAGADAIIFHMDTPGGVVTVAEKLIRMILDLPDDIKTYTYVDKDALSAGALIAIATDQIYMAPGSRIGASAIVTPFGDIEEGDTKEKHLSAALALVQYAAKMKGRDPNLVEAMVRREYEYKIGEEILCPVGQLLTFDNAEAERLVGKEGEESPILSHGTANDIPDLVDKIGRAGTQVITPLLTPSEKLTRYAKLFALLFLIGGVIGIYIEVKTPGFGIPGVLGMILLMFFFWAQYIAGTAGTIEFLIFIIGMAFLLLEVFVVPGFGFTGITGIFCIALSIFMAMVQHFPGESVFSFPDFQIPNALTKMSLATVVAFTFMVILAKYLPKTPMFAHIALQTTLSHEKGYEASAPTNNIQGLSGEALTDLRPSGIGIFDGKRMSVVARGEFIEQGQPIMVAETHGNRIIVDRATGEPESVVATTESKET